MELSDLRNNDKAVITKVRGRGAFRKRITEMGFVKGKEVMVVKDAPLKDPIQYKIMGYEISLRRSEANLIEVITPDEAKGLNMLGFEGVSNGDLLRKSASERGKIINIALVGNPNCGKTTLFNSASGAKEHVGNYSGVTVDAKLGRFKQKGYTFNIADLPGTYSLTAYSPEELYVRNYILNEIPDIVINVIDASNLERNLYLTTQLIDMDIRVVIALNMYDELLKKGDNFDYNSLGDMIGIPFIPTISSKGKGIEELFDKIIEVYEDKAIDVRHIHINYGKCVEKVIEEIQTKIKISDNFSVTDKISSRFLAIKLAEKDKEAIKVLEQCCNTNEIIAASHKGIKKIESCQSDDSETIITDAKYGFIAGALKETYKDGGVARRRKTEIVDTFVTHKVWGFPIFITFMWVMFQTTFTVGEYPMNWIISLVGLIGDSINTLMPDGMLKDLLIDGIIGGVGGVVIFLPNILILFFFISLMEDTGYMARAAFIMDKLMHKIGLHGKSFIPLIMGFGCNVPAIMSTRTLENRNDRLLTMLINPFMSCSARLPVYLLITGAFFIDHPGTVIFLIYFIGIVLAISVAILFKKTLFKSKDVPFVMELPPYRIPTMKATFRHMWHKGAHYLKKMGGVILVASIIIWALGYFPRKVESAGQFDKKIAETELHFAEKIKLIDADNTDIISSLTREKESAIDSIESNKEAKRQEHSYIGKLGHFIEPIIKPLGFDWKMGVSILSGVVAKEVVVSTMGVLYQANMDSKNTKSLEIKLRNEVYQYGANKGENVFNPLVAFSFLLFVLIYFPCVAVIVTIRKESGSWKWAAFTVFYTTAIAWIASFIVFQFGSFLCL
jgi:ferrous iron transport protein B